MDLKENWDTIRRIFEDSFKSCTHYAMATVDAAGNPHVTPIGSLVLGDNQAGYYFEEFTSQMPANFHNNRRIAILAVNADKLFWAKSLIRGKFSRPPGIRLLGTAGERREASVAEIATWHDKLKDVKKTKGYDILWKDMVYVREITFDGFLPIRFGSMTDIRS